VIGDESENGDCDEVKLKLYEFSFWTTQTWESCYCTVHAGSDEC